MEQERIAPASEHGRHTLPLALGCSRRRPSDRRRRKSQESRDRCRFWLDGQSRSATWVKLASAATVHRGRMTKPTSGERTCYTGDACTGGWGHGRAHRPPSVGLVAGSGGDTSDSVASFLAMGIRRRHHRAGHHSRADMASTDVIESPDDGRDSHHLLQPASMLGFGNSKIQSAPRNTPNKLLRLPMCA